MKLRIYILILSLFASFSAIATDYNDQRIVQRSFKVTPDLQLEVDNMYGDVRFTTWDSDSVRVRAEISAFSDDMGNVREMLSEIEVKIKKSGSFLILETVWADEVSFIKKGIYDIKRSFGSGQRVKVDLSIWLPDGLDIEVVNRFGDVYFDSYSGDVDIEVSHGDLRGNDLLNPNKIKVEYGKVKLRKIGNGKLELAYAESVRIDEANDLFVTSSSSDIEIEAVNLLQIDSRNDDIRIEKVGKLTGTSFITDFRIQSVTGVLDLNCRMGELRIRSVKPSCTILKIKSSGTDLMIDFDPFYEGTIEAQLENVREWSCTLPEYVQTDETVIERQRTIEGFKGMDKTNSVQLNVKNASVRLGG